MTNRLIGFQSGRGFLYSRQVPANSFSLFWFLLPA